MLFGDGGPLVAGRRLKKGNVGVMGSFWMRFTQVSNEDKTRNRNSMAFMMVLYGSHYSIMEK